MDFESDEAEDLEITTTISSKKKKRNGKSKKEKFGESKKLLKEQKKAKMFLTNKHNYIWQKRRNTYIISIDELGNPVLTIGPDWIYYVLLSIFITGGFLFLFIKFYQFVPLYLLISGIITYLLFIIPYTILFLIDPGYPEKVDMNLLKKGKKNYIYCSICNIWMNKNMGIRHCQRCGMCVEKYDHHCDWIGKCVGKKNINYFYFIIIWVVMVFIYFIAAFVIVHENWFQYQRYLRQKEKMKNNDNK